MKDWDDIPASELKVGDVIRLTFMGGAEDVTVGVVRKGLDGRIRWAGGNSVVDLPDNHVESDQILRRVRS